KFEQRRRTNAERLKVVFFKRAGGREQECHVLVQPDTLERENRGPFWKDGGGGRRFGGSFCRFIRHRGGGDFPESPLRLLGRAPLRTGLRLGRQLRQAAEGGVGQPDQLLLNLHQGHAAGLQALDGHELEQVPPAVQGRAAAHLGRAVEQAQRRV